LLQQSSGDNQVLNKTDRFGPAGGGGAYAPIAPPRLRAWPMIFHVLSKSGIVWST